MRKSPNKRILSYKDALQRTGCERIEATLRTRRSLRSGALLRMGDHRLPKKFMTGELDHVGRGDVENMHGLGGRESSGFWHHGRLEYRRTRPWVLVRHSWVFARGEFRGRFLRRAISREQAHENRPQFMLAKIAEELAGPPLKPSMKRLQNTPEFLRFRAGILRSSPVFCFLHYFSSIVHVLEFEIEKRQDKTR